MKRHKEHTRCVGQLVVDLQNLELSLRIHLLAVQQLSWPDYDESLVLGAELPCTAFTDFRQLRELLRDYNGLPGQTEVVQDAQSLVDLRDALAHGRVAAPRGEKAMRLLKFDRPVNGIVRVTYCAVMNATWFKTQLKMIQDALRTVFRANERLGICEALGE